MMQKIYKFFKEKKEKGQSIIEYAILLAVIGCAVLTLQGRGTITAQLDNLEKQIGSTVASVAAKTSAESKT